MILSKLCLIECALWLDPFIKGVSGTIYLHSSCFTHFLQGQTALHLAAKFGRSDVISLLVDNHGKRRIILTALHNILEFIIEGVDVYARDHAGKQPRDIASAKVKEECKGLAVVVIKRADM